MYKFEIINELEKVLDKDMPNRDKIIDLYAEFSMKTAAMQEELDQTFTKLYEDGYEPDETRKSLLLCVLAIAQGMPAEMAADVARMYVSASKMNTKAETYGLDEVVANCHDLPLEENPDPLPESMIGDMPVGGVLLNVRMKLKDRDVSVWVDLDGTSEVDGKPALICSLAGTHPDIDLNVNDTFNVLYNQIWGMGGK